MPGPLPKTRSARQRQNVAAGARTLRVVHDTPTPKLPTERKWHKETRAWWRAVWASPMAPEYDASDQHGLFLLAVLVDEFWLSPSTSLASEIRLQRQCFGLTPIDRRRLQWETDRGEEAAAATKRRRAPAAVADDGLDPRRLLA